MACRTDEKKVAAVIEVDADVSLTQFIKTASALVDKVVAKDTGGELTSELQENIETYLAAHFYALYDAQLQSKTTGRAGGTFQGQTGLGLDLTWWGQQAKMMDISGFLAGIDKGKKKARLRWAGTSADSVRPDTRQT